MQTTSPDEFANAEAFVLEVLRRDRRRLRATAAVTILLWILAALLIPAIYLPLWAKVDQTASRLVADNGELTARQVAEAISELARGTMPVAAIMMAILVLTCFLAAALTVSLSLMIRRATLRQVSANLTMISQQLKQLQASRAA
ncbi:MAG: hypothetical protein QM770_04160 [Tepidisphaeraceae bacterium]